MSLREASLALGAPQWVTDRHAWSCPAGVRGIVAGILLSLARVAGETAPLLFTAFSNRFWSDGWLQPTASLPVMIFTYAVSPYEDWHRQAWAAGARAAVPGARLERARPSDPQRGRRRAFRRA